MRNLGWFIIKPYNFIIIVKKTLKWHNTAGSSSLLFIRLGYGSLFCASKFQTHTHKMEDSIPLAIVRECAVGCEDCIGDEVSPLDT